jgi:putative SOS response-associated peptidase YedK
MCGRFVQASPFHVVAEAFNIGAGPGDVPSRYNIVPGQLVSAVIRKAGEDRNRLVQFRWGLVPSWAKDPSVGNRMINARVESVAEKPSFRDAFLLRRCLVVADGFYEWRREGRTRIPYFVHLKSGRPFGIAGLYETWTPPSGEPVRTCTIITVPANEFLKPIHDRMPAIIPRDREDLWLDPSVRDKTRLLEILRPYPAGELEVYEVSRAVNSPRSDSPDLIKPLKSA